MTEVHSTIACADPQETVQSPPKGRRCMIWLAVAGWLLSSPVTVALALVTAAVRPHLIQLVS